MNYDLLKMIGLGNLDITYIFIGLMVFLLIILILMIVQMVKLSKMTKKNEKDIRSLYRNFEKAFQKIGVVKYDAFSQMGGQLSFSLALLDENDNGFILNSVHSTEGCYTYTKEIKHGECSIELGDEEKKALNIAIGEDD